MSLRTFIRSLLDRIRQALDRYRVRRFHRLGLPSVRDTLAHQPSALPPAPASLRMPAYRPADDGHDYQAPEPSLRWMAGEKTPALRLTTTKALPPAPPELAVLRLDAWHKRPDRLPFDRTPRRVASLGQVRPEVFGVEEAQTRVERAAPPPLADPLLVPAPHRPASPVRLRPPEALGQVAPEAFGLAADGTPPTELEPVAARSVMKLPRARASFLFRFTEPASVERILSPAFSSPTDGLEEKLEPFFDRPDPGAHPPVAARIDETVAHSLDEVREQFLLRRGIGRVEVDEWELGSLEALDGLGRGSIRVFSGVAFEDLQPEPVEPLRMRLENPPVDLAPSIEASVDARTMLARALADFSSDPARPPPVPELPERFRR